MRNGREGHNRLKLTETPDTKNERLTDCSDREIEKNTNDFSCEKAKMNREVIIAEEDRLRRLVANGQRDELVNNTSFVKDVFALGPQAVAGVEETDEERPVPHVLDSAWRRGTEPMIETDKAKFEASFGDFTGHLLDGLDWSNVVAAGSSVLAAATTAPQREQLYATADIDLFFYGLTSDDAANAKLRQVYSVVARNTKGGEAPMVVRTGRAVSIVGTYPTRTVQVVLRLYSCPAEVLLGFDVDCCALAYDGQRLLATQRSLYALTRNVNVVNPTRRSLTYESRLYKYAKRGFAVVVPGLELARINEAAVRSAGEQYRLAKKSGMVALSRCLVITRVRRPSTTQASRLPIRALPRPIQVAATPKFQPNWPAYPTNTTEEK